MPFSAPSPPPKPQAIAISQHHGLEPPQQSPTRRGSIATHLMNFASRSTTSLNILSSSAPTTPSGPTTPSDDSRSLRPSVLSGRSSPFSNPFKKLQHSLQGGSPKKHLELGGPRGENNKVISSSASAMTLTSWRSKAEMLSKKSWGRSRKNSEPTFGGLALPQTPIFGASLEDAIRSSHIQDSPMVPGVLFRCAEFLEAKGVDEVGLYRHEHHGLQTPIDSERGKKKSKHQGPTTGTPQTTLQSDNSNEAFTGVPGSHASVQKLKKMFDSGKDYNLLAMDGIDPNDIATLLKLYLRELPTPLLPAFLLEQFQSVITTDRHICHTLRGILIRLPRNNYVVLSFLCHHLSRIASHSEKTKMNVSNLGVVFAPTLSIGSILFRALLGGYYDSEDTAESREKGLKIVWGGLLQDFEYDLQEWPEDQQQQPADGDRLHPLELNPPSSSPSSSSSLHGNNIAAEENRGSNNVPEINLATTPSTTIPTFSQSMPNDHQFGTLVAPTALAPPVVLTLTVEQEEAYLLQEMLRKENAASGAGCDDDEVSSNASETPSNPCSENTVPSVVSSPGMNAKELAFEASFTSPSMAFSPAFETTTPSHLTATATATTATTTGLQQQLPTTTNSSSDGIFQTTSTATTASTTTTLTTTISASTSSLSLIPSIEKSLPPLPTLNFETESDLEPATAVVGRVNDISDDDDNDAQKENSLTSSENKSASGAPQLPPLEGLMISL
ncbi:hypothetical protein BG004_002421 [Podila humilis]|nr:hypothetical protein BG004_002421 [Podila humilis]